LIHHRDCVFLCGAALILQSSGFVMPWDEAIAQVLPAIDQSLWDLQPLPTNPGNLTSYAGVYLASVLGGYDIA
jgi:hypothetical protein